MIVTASLNRSVEVLGCTHPYTYVKAFYKWLRGPRMDTDSMETANQVEGPVWCVVANMRAVHPYGPGGQETRRGTSHFAPGARLWVRRTMGWNSDMPDLEVVGRHRATHRLVRMVVDGALLERWRAALVYSPEVIRLLQPYFDGSHASRQKAEERVSLLAKASGLHGSGLEVV